MDYEGVACDRRSPCSGLSKTGSVFVINVVLTVEGVSARVPVNSVFDIGDEIVWLTRGDVHESSKKNVYESRNSLSNQRGRVARDHLSISVVSIVGHGGRTWVGLGS